MIPRLISPAQGALVHGRQILDEALIANECFHARHKDRRPGLICKLDLKKAYDKVDWEFLLFLVRRMGFGAKWRAWIVESVSSTYFSTLVNGSPKGFFPSF